MTHEFEFYHGAVLRDLVVASPDGLSITACDDTGRVNSFLVNGEIALHLKHSSKRLPPWQFTFNAENVDELNRLAKKCRSLWLVLVCGHDGFMSLSLPDFYKVNPPTSETTRFIRVDRDRGTMYRLTGTGGKLSSKRPRGLSPVIADISSNSEDKI